MLGWQGTGSNQACLHQFMQRVHTLACHQIAGFLAMVIDGQTYNFGTDLVLLTSANNIDPIIGWLGPPGMWGFTNNSNPWVTSIFFVFVSGDPGNQTQPFPNLLAGTVWNTGSLSWIVGSSRWTPECLQQAQGLFVTGANRPDFTANGLNLLGGTTPDGGGSWICLGRSQYATCLPDDDGTQNQGGFSNSALAVADYLTTPKNEFGLGAELTLDSIDTVIAAANVCDEPTVIEIF